LVGEGTPESAITRELLEPGAGIGDGDKLRAASIPLGVVDKFPEVGEERHDFDGSAGFTRDEKQRPCRLNGLGHLPYPARHGGVQHPEPGSALRCAEGAAQHLGSETTASHSEEYDVGRMGFASRLRKGPQVGESILHVVQDRQPAQPVIDFSRV
jgi:hypothetical protein